MNFLVPRQYRRYFAKFYAYPDSDPTAMLRAPWALSLRCHGAHGVSPATLWRVCCDARPTCFRGDLTARVLSMFKTWRRPRRPRRPYCDLQRCHGRSHNDPAAIWPILQIAARSPSCVTRVLPKDCDHGAPCCDWTSNRMITTWETTVSKWFLFVPIPNLVFLSIFTSKINFRFIFVTTFYEIVLQ